MASETTTLENCEREGRPESRAARMIREVFESGRPLTYIRSAEEQRVAAGAGARWRASWSPPARCPSGPGASPRGCAAEATGGGRHRDASRSAGLHHRAPGSRHLPPQRLPRAAAGIRRDPAPPAGRLRELPRPAASSWSSPRRCGSFPRNSSGASCFSNCGRPTWSNWWSFCARRPPAPSDEAVLHQIARALQGLTLDEARYALRRALARGGAWDPSPCPPCSKRSGCWSTAAA